MRVVGNKDGVNEILLTHKGRNLKFQCFVKPFPYPIGLDLEERRSAEIAFDDLQEVDSLIDMLERFKRETKEYMGVWRGERT